jgi:single-strand DNA-binding protein
MAMDLNKVQIIGRITQDIELKQTPNGQNVTTLSVATNRNYTDGSGVRQEQSEFHNIVLWGKLAEIASQYLAKGRRVYIEGRLQTRSWDAQDGTKRYRTEIVGENMIMLDGKGPDTDASSSSPSYEANSTPDVKRTTQKQEPEISIEDIPF